jgi:hypothetical protein
MRNSTRVPEGYMKRSDTTYCSKDDGFYRRHEERFYLRNGFFKIGLLFFLLFASAPTFLAAQSNVGLRGKVVDTTAQPLEFAVVCLLNANDSTQKKCGFSAADGSFSINNLSAGNYRIRISFMGYLPYESAIITIDSTAHNVVEAPVAVLRRSSAKLLNEVSITGTKPLVERKIDRTVLNVENSVIAKGNSALEILQSAPGVGESKDGSFSLRGKEGTLVMINDKQTYLSASQLADLLRNTPGTNVQSVELITNPPAKYEAQGTGGIINIRMKTVKSQGASVSLNSLAGYGKYYKWSQGVTANLRTGKLNINANFITSGNKRFNNQDVQRINTTKEETTRFDQQANRVREIGYNHFNTTVDYFINPKNTLTAFVDGSFNTAKQTLYNNTLISKVPGKTDSSYESVAPLKSNYSDMRYGISYEWKIDTSGSVYSLDFTGGRFDAKEKTTYNNAYFLPDRSMLKPSDTLRINSPIKIDIYSFKTDYSHPWANHKHTLDAGLKFTYVKTDNNFGFDSLRDNTFYNTIFSNHFIYKENVNAGYLNYSFKANNTALQIGLRAEQTNSEGYSADKQDEKIKRHYLNFFPSVFIDQKLADGNVLNFAYSRRIDRPSYEDLNPFVYYLDQFTFSQGNPYLRPQYSNSFEFNYTLKDKYIVTLGYVHVGQVMSEVVITDTVAKTLIFSYDNLAKEDVYSFAFTIPVDFTRWWSSLMFFNGNHNHIATPDFYGLGLDYKKFSYNFTVNETFRIDKSTKFELNFAYQSPYITGTIFYNKPLYNLDLGISRSFNKNLTIGFSLRDIFNTKARYFTSLLPDQQYQYHQKLETRVARLTLAYKFGNTRISKGTNKPNASQEELDRIKGAN